MADRELIEIVNNAQDESKIGRILGKLTRSSGISIPRVGGGVRVAVISFNPETPNSIVEQTIELRRARESCVMPFDKNVYESVPQIAE